MVSIHNTPGQPDRFRECPARRMIRGEVFAKRNAEREEGTTSMMNQTRKDGAPGIRQRPSVLRHMAKPCPLRCSFGVSAAFSSSFRPVC